MESSKQLASQFEPLPYSRMVDKVAEDIFTFVNYEELTISYAKKDLCIKEFKDYYAYRALKAFKDYFKDKGPDEIYEMLSRMLCN